MCQIAEGLEYTHRKGILHRDIKPSNIILVSADRKKDEGGVRTAPAVKILDFGLARLIDYSRSMDGNAVAGSFSYMAPEQAGIFRQPVDQRADLYSLGILCYELLSGHLPYTGDEPGLILQQHLTKVPLPLIEVNPRVPGGLSRIVERLMAKSPQNRYFSAKALVADLRALEASLQHGGGRICAVCPNLGTFGEAQKTRPTHRAFPGDGGTEMLG